MPGFVTVNVDPNISSASNLLSLALYAKSEDDLAKPIIFFSGNLSLI